MTGNYNIIKLAIKQINILIILILLYKIDVWNFKYYIIIITTKCHNYSIITYTIYDRDGDITTETTTTK